MPGVVKGKVERYDVDGLQALNFVAHDALGGGVSRSLCLDNYGKSLSARVLAFELEIPDSLRSSPAADWHSPFREGRVGN